MVLWTDDFDCFGKSNSQVLKVCADWFSDACKHFPEEAAEAAMKLPPSARAPALAYAGLEMPQSPSSDSSSS